MPWYVCDAVRCDTSPSAWIGTATAGKSCNIAFVRESSFLTTFRFFFASFAVAEMMTGYRRCPYKIAQVIAQ